MMSKQHNSSFLWRILVLLALTLTVYWPVAVTQLDLATIPPKQCHFTQHTWRLSWQHSVEQSAWSDTYQRRGQNLHLQQTTFKSFGAGMPSSGTVLPAPTGYVAYAIHLNLPELNWVVSRHVRSTLWLGTQPWPLFNWVPDHTEIRFTPTYMPFWRTLMKDFCHAQ